MIYNDRATNDDVFIDDVLSMRLRKRLETTGPEWKIWEHKTFNIHRSVLHWRPANKNLSFEEMANVVAKKLKESFRVAWWRGFGFGVLIESVAVPQDIAALYETIDSRVKSQGTWQWTVLACPNAQMTVGVRTWKEGYLSATYRGLINHFESVGYSTGSFNKEKDKLMQFLTAAAN